MMRLLVRVATAVSAVACLTTALAFAQQTATTTETKKFQVIAVEGNQLVVRLPEGTREITVPAGFRFTVDGKQLSVGELKPGMAGTATITTTTTVTPVTVTEIKNGTVRHVAGNTIIVQTDEGFRQFTQAEVDKRGVKIYRSGEPAELSRFRPGDRLSATIVTTKPPNIVTQQQVDATLARSGSAGGGTTAAAAARPPATPSAPRTASANPAGTGAAPAAGAGAPARTLPKTASPAPLVGLVGLASIFTAWGLATIRRRRDR
jgi:LPXTG-motif cell wall-anchored protein